MAMKKPLLVLLLCLCCAPCFSQGVKAGLQGVEAGVKGVPAAGQIEKNLAQQVQRACAASQVRLAQITNMPGQPTVQVRVDASVPVSSAAVLQARMLPSRQVYQSISSVLSRRPYLPSAFAETKDVLYRGMRLTQLSDLENILRQGLEIRRTGYSELYFSYAPSMALTYALPRSINEKEAGDFPVVVKVPITTQLPVSCTGVNAQAYKDLPAEFISDVMVFLEINGHADWYKAILENDKLLLISVPTTRTPGYLSREIRTSSSSSLEWIQNIEPASLARQATNWVNQRQVLADLLNSHTVKKLEFPDLSAPVSSVLITADDINTATVPARARILPNDKFSLGNKEYLYLDAYLTHLSAMQERAFLYRGMHVSGLQEINTVLHHGLEVNKTHYDVIYMGDLFAAKIFAVNEPKTRIPVIVGVPGELLVPHLKFNTAFHEAEFPFDIPPTMFSQLLVFLEIDGEPGWYKVMLDEEKMVFISVKWLHSSGIEM